MLLAKARHRGDCCFIDLCYFYGLGGRIDNAIAIKQRHRTNPGTEAEPQQIVAQRLLSCLQYPVPFKSSTEDLTRPTFGSVVK